ncbi:MAG TPA: hypothetical protein VFO55_02470 [Gemmatimonadaceae bacterium]|nr:hypothetical protein [Gemmatimonadaceae bacterium]
MPLVRFSELPDNARIWVFGSDQPLTGAVADSLLAEVDAYLDQWKAHGFPLRAAREWRDDRFLVIGIDPTAEQASGCSIDGLFRALQTLQKTIGAQLLGGGRVFYRDATGAPQSVSREDFTTLAAQGAIGPKTPVFDTSVTRLDDWRARFERPLAESWAAALSA